MVANVCGPNAGIGGHYYEVIDEGSICNCGQARLELVDGGLRNVPDSREWLPDANMAGPKMRPAQGEEALHRCSERGCQARAIMVLERQIRPRYNGLSYGYIRRQFCCAEHAYGRRLIDGVVCWPYEVGSASWVKAKEAQR